MNVRRLPSLRPIAVSGLLALFILLLTAATARAQALTMNVGPDLGAFSTGEMQYSLIATGGNGTYTWDITAGSLPPGVALRTDKPFWFPANASAGLIGVPTVPGRYTFTLRVRSAGAADLSVPTAMTITALNVNEPFDLPDGLTNTAYSYTLTPLNNPGAVTWAFVNGSLPPGLGLSAAGTISGTPTAPGLFNFTYSLNDGTNTIYRGANIRVTGVKITSAILANATENAPYGPVTIQATGGTGAYTFTQDGGLPPGLSMNSAGVITGTPTGAGWRWGFTVHVTDSANNTHSRVLNIFVDTASRHVPSLNPFNDDCTIGTYCRLGIGVGNGGTPPFAITATGLPTGMTAFAGGVSANTYVWPGDIEVSGVPTGNGSFLPEFQLTESAGGISKNTFPLHVSKLAQRTDRIEGVVGSAYSATLRIIGGTPPYHATLVRGPLPAGVTYDPTTLTISGTPAEAGAFGPLFDITDSTGQTLRAGYYFSIQNVVAGINIGTGWDLGTTTSGSFYSNQLFACCAGSLTWSIVGGALPPGITLSSGGLLSGSSSTPGAYTFLVKAADSNNPSRFDVRQFQLLVSFVQIQTGGLQTGFVGSPYSQDLSASFGSGILSWTLDPSTYLPPGISLVRVDQVQWRLSGIPTAPGQFVFRLLAVDGSGIPNSRWFSIFVFPAGVTPPIDVTTSSNLGTWVIGEVEVPITATGGTGTYSWQLLSGQMPPGVSLRVAPDLAPWFQPSQNAGFIGIATTTGTYNFTMRVTSGSQTIDLPFTVKVISLSTNDPFNLPNAFIGEPYSYAFTASGNSGPAVFTPNSLMPPGLTLSSAGVLSGTPTTAGFFNPQIVVTDANGPFFRGFNLSVFDLRITSSGALPNAQLNVPYLAHINVAGGTAPYHFDISGGLPSGLALDPNTGDISGTPTTTFLGRQSFNVTVTDSKQLSFTKNMAIVMIAGQPSVARLIPYGNEWDDCTYAVYCGGRGISVTNGGKPPFNWTATGLPAGLAIRFGDATTLTPFDAEIFGLPREIGTFVVHVTMTDADGIVVSNDFPLRISELMQGDGLPSGTINQPYSTHLRVIGGTPPYTATIIDGALPAGLSFDAGTLNITGTPVENGSFFVTLRITDSAGKRLTKWGRSLFIGGGTSTVSISSSDLGIALIGQNFSSTLFACCLPNAFTWSLLSGALPDGLALSSGGVISGTPTAAVGKYQFLVKAADAINPGNFAVRQITLTLSNLSITSGNPPVGNVGTPFSFTLTASGGSGTRTWSLAPFQLLPPGLSLSSDGVISGTPTGAFFASVNVRVTDTAGNIATRFVSVVIYPAGVYPPLTFSFSTGFTGQLGTFSTGIQSTSITGGLPPYQLSMTPGSEVVPGMRVISEAALKNFFGTTAIAGYAGVLTTPGVYHPSIRVTDANGTFIDKPFTFTVVPFAITSPTTLPKATRNVPYSYQLVPYDGGATLSWTGVQMPAGLSVDPATGLISGTPTVAGATSLRVQLTDLLTSASLTPSFNITIDPFAITTSALLPAGAVGSAYSTQFSAPDCGSPCNWTGSPGLGLTISSTGLLSGTPGSGFNGTFTVTASGPNGTVSKIFSLFIAPTAMPALAITTTTLADVVTGNSLTVAMNATGGTPPYNWALDSGDLPPGVWLTGSGADYSANLGTGFAFLLGRAMQPGTYTFTVRVTDQNDVSATRAFTWNVSRLGYLSTALPLGGTTLVYNQPYTQALLALGGTGTYSSWTNLTATPAGLALNATSGVVSGTPGNTGSVTTQVRVNDDQNNSFTGNWTFNIAGPTATLLNFPITALTVTPGIQFSTSVTPTNGTGPYTVTALSPLPPGLILATASDPIAGGSTGGAQIVLTGIPLTPGVYPVTLQALDSSPIPNTGVRTITVTVVSAIATTINLPDGSVGHAYSQPLIAFDTTGPVTWSVAATSGMPPGISLDPAGAIVGIPTQAGTFSFALFFSNPAGFVAGRTYTLNVSPIFVDSPAVLPTATVGVPYNHTLTSTGGAGTVLWSAAFMPPGLSLSSLGVISGTPTAAGVFTFSATATDGVRPINRQFAIPIKAASPALLDVGLAATRLNDLVAGVYGVLNLNASNGVPPYSWRLASGSSLPDGLRLVTGSAAGTSFLPTATIIAGIPSTPGLYSFDLIVTDAAGSEVRRTYTLRVTRVALLTGGIPNVIAGTAFSTRFVAVGGTAPYTFTMSPVNATQEMLPPGINLTNTGQLSGTTTSTGFYSFQLRAQDDAGNSITRTFSLNVVTSSGLQVVNGNPPDLWVGGGLRGETDLRTNGSSTYAWTLREGLLPPGLRIERGTVGGPNVTEIVGAPTTPGVYTFTLRATDDVNASNFAEHAFTVRIAPMQIVSPPVALLADLSIDLPSGRAGVPYSFTLKAAGGTPPYTYAQSPFVPLPAGLTLTPAGVVEGTTSLTGRFIIAPIVTDSAGRVLNSPGMGLVIAPAGAPLPLVLGNFDGDLPGASAGAPFSFPLDRLIRTGTGPFTWTVAPLAANALPEGMMLISGTNGTDSYLAGTPKTAGEYEFVLMVTDSSVPQHSLTVPFSLPVSALALTPDSLAPGKAGIPYAKALVPSGGIPPYSVSLYPPSDLPAGMTFSNGMLSGTPTSAGNFLMAVIARDSGGHELFKIYRLAIDNAIGEAPSLGLAPRSISVRYEIGSPAPPPVLVTVTTTTGSKPFSLALSGVPGASLSATSGNTNATVSLNLNTASLPEGIYNGLLAASAPGAANIIDEVPVSLTIEKAPGCTFTVSPTVRGAPSAGEPVAKSFAVLTGPTCKWTAVASDPWIIVSPGASATGNGTVYYTVAPNNTSTLRTGTILVNGVPFTVTQYGTTCTFTLNPTTINATASGGQTFVGVLAPVGCTFTSSSSELTLTPPPIGKVGVNVTVPLNLGPSRILSATIAGQPFLVYQAGIECTATLSPYGATVPADGSTGSVGITLPAACSYNTVTGPNWITVTSGATGAGPSGNLVYSVAANPTTVPRTGTLTIGGQSFVITQDPLACSATVDTTSLGSPYGPAGATGSIGITANGTNCAWTASSNVPWATLSAISGTGSGTIGVTVISNAASLTGRTGTFTVAGQTINISQSGTACTFELGSDTGSAPAAGGTGSVRVTSPSVCQWSASTSASWLSIIASGSGGTGDVRFAAEANQLATARTGTLTIANTTYTVNQAGATCAFNITGSSTSPTFASDGASGQVFNFTSTIAGCAAPAAVSYASWITVDASTFSGTSGSVTYSALPNPFGTTRRGTIQVGSATFTVVQSGSACAYSLNEYGRIFHSTGGDAVVLGTPTAPACTPATGTNQPSFITLSPLAGPDLNIFSLPYNVAPFTPLTPLIRYGNITFGGQIVLIKQYSW